MLPSASDHTTAYVRNNLCFKMEIQNIAEFRHAIDEISSRAAVRREEYFPLFGGPAKSFKIHGTLSGTKQLVTAHITIKDAFITDICIEHLATQPGAKSVRRHATPTSCEHHRRTGHNVFWKEVSKTHTKQNEFFGFALLCNCKPNDVMADHLKATNKVPEAIRPSSSPADDESEDLDKTEILLLRKKNEKLMALNDSLRKREQELKQASSEAEQDLRKANDDLRKASSKTEHDLRLAVQNHQTALNDARACIKSLEVALGVKESDLQALKTSYEELQRNGSTLTGQKAEFITWFIREASGVFADELRVKPEPCEDGSVPVYGCFQHSGEGSSAVRAAHREDSEASVKKQAAVFGAGAEVIKKEPKKTKRKHREEESDALVLVNGSLVAMDMRVAEEEEAEKRSVKRKKRSEK